ncbi:hypothetical protein [Aureliella helgolandensis]|nr:hypothetical protein [Aureliella helgolandensis]
MQQVNERSLLPEQPSVKVWESYRLGAIATGQQLNTNSYKQLNRPYSR